MRSRHRGVKALRLLIALAMLVATVGMTASTAAATNGHGSKRAPRVAGMVIVESNQSVDDTWSSLLAALEANPNIRIVAKIDHAAAAGTVGLELAENRVVVFGNPNLGTPLMQVNQTVGLDLPQKIQVFEKTGRVWVGFNDATYLQARHHLGDAPTLATIAGALRNLTGVAVDGEVDARSFGNRRFSRRPALITVASDASTDVTWNRLLAAIEASPANTAFVVDHQAGAASVGLDLRPTRVVAFGNPNLGTPLMQAQPTAGIDLPIKFLVWEDEHGQTFVTTNDVGLARRHKLKRRDLGPISTAVENFLQAATTTS